MLEFPQHAPEAVKKVVTGLADAGAMTTHVLSDLIPPARQTLREPTTAAKQSTRQDSQDTFASAFEMTADPDEQREVPDPQIAQADEAEEAEARDAVSGQEVASVDADPAADSRQDKVVAPIWTSRQSTPATQVKELGTPRAQSREPQANVVATAPLDSMSQARDAHTTQRTGDTHTRISDSAQGVGRRLVTDQNVPAMDLSKGSPSAPVHNTSAPRDIAWAGNRSTDPFRQAEPAQSPQANVVNSASASEAVRRGQGTSGIPSDPSAAGEPKQPAGHSEGRHTATSPAVLPVATATALTSQAQLNIQRQISDGVFADSGSEAWDLSEWGVRAEVAAGATSVSGGSSASAALPTAAGPAGGATTAQQIGAQIANGLSRASDGRIEIALNPKELGHVRVSVSGQEGVWIVAIQAERSESAELMRRHFDVLAQEFRELGFGSLEFSFGERRPDDSGSWLAQEFEPESGHLRSDDQDVPHQPAPQSTGLDWRV